MTDLRQAAQQALEALECLYNDTEIMVTLNQHRVMKGAITNLRAALAEPEQEPVRLQCTTCGTVYADGVPPQVPEQEPQTTHWEGCEEVHPECRKPEQNPFGDDAERYARKLREEREAYKTLCTAPTPRKPLTDAEIWNTYKNLWMFHPAEEPRLAGDVLKFARAIERKHGIGEQHE